MAKLGSIYVDVRAKTDKYQRDLANAKTDTAKAAVYMGNQLSKIDFKAVGVAALAFGATVAIGMKKAIDAASNLEETVGKFNVVFAGHAKQAEDMSKILVSSYAMSTREAKQYLSSVQDLLVPMGMAADKAILMSNEVVKLSADLASFNNQPTATVMADIQSALVGNFETMKKYGVVLNETVIKQAALNKGMWDGKGMVDANTKAQIAFELMLKGSAAALGDQQRTMGSYANQMKQFTANVEDLSAMIGNELLPTATEIVNTMNNWVKANKGLIEQKTKETIDGISDSLGKVVAIYNVLPPELIGAAGHGLVGRILLGSNPGKIIFMLSLVDNFAEKFGMNAGNIVDDMGDLSTVFQNMIDVLTGKKDWNTGALKEYENDVRHVINALDDGKEYFDSWRIAVKDSNDEIVPVIVDLVALQKELENTEKILKDSADTWGNAFDIDMGGIDEVQSAIDIMLNARNNEALALEKNIALQKEMLKAVEDTYGVDWGTEESRFGPPLEEAAKDRDKYISDTTSEFSNMFGTMANLYDEDSSKKKQMHTAQLAMNAIELASNLEKAIGLAVTASINQGQGDPYTAFARVAAMTAMMGLLLSQIGGSISGGGGATQATATPVTGTVLGYSTLVSSSISNIDELLNDIHAEEYSELKGIHDEMKDLNSSISGLVSNLFISGADFTGAGIDTGYTAGATEDWINSFWPDVLGGSFVADFWGSVFGGSQERSVVGQGLSGDSISISDLISGEGVNAQSYSNVFVEEDGGWFGSNSYWIERYSEDLDSSITDLFTKMFFNLSESFLSLGEILGQDASTIEDFVFDIGDIDLTNLSTAEEINDAISSALSGISDAAATSLFGDLIGQYQEVGEGMLETAVRVASELIVVKDIVETTNQAFTGTTAEAIAFSQAVINLAGDFDTLYDSFSTYYDKFFSDMEKQSDIAETLASSLITVPESRDDYRSAIEAIDMSTEDGQELYITMLNLAETADSYYSYLEDIAERTEDFFSSIDSIIAEYSMSDYDFGVYNLNKWYEEQVELAEELGLSLETLNEAYELQLEALDAAQVEEATEELEDLTDQINAFNNSLNDIVAQNTLSDYEYSLYQLNEWYAEQIELAEELGQDIDIVNQAYIEQIRSLRDLEGFYTNLSDIINQNTLSDYENDLISLNEWYAEQIELAEELGIGIDRVNQAYQSQLNALNETSLEIARSNYVDAIGREIEALTEETELLEGAVDDARTAYIDALNEEIETQNDIVTAAESAASALESVIDALGNAMSLIISETFSSPVDAFQYAQNEYNSILSSAMAGDITALESLPNAASNYLTAAQSTMTDYLGYQGLASQIYSQLENAQTVAETQLSEQEDLMSLAESQIDILNAQVDAADGIEESILSLIELEDAYNQAVLEFEESGLESQMEIYNDMLTELEALNNNFMTLAEALQSYESASYVYDGESYSFAGGGTVSGSKHGYTIPTTFHGVEHITPDSEMSGVKTELAEIKKILFGILNVDADNGDMLDNILRIYKRNMRNGTKFRVLVDNPVTAPVNCDEVP